MKEILLKDLKTKSIIDDLDYDRVIKHRWAFSHGYAKTYIDGIQWEMGEFILGFKQGTETDHRNLNKLDNRRNNLRKVTHKQNCANRGAHKDGESGYKGVRRLRNKWAAKIRIEGKDHHLGSFDDIEEAAHQYDKAAIEHFGEFAKTNF